MASYYHTIPDPEELVQCPYDPVHMIRMKKIQYHLMKCRKNFPNRVMSSCPFNNCHVVPEAEYRFHVSTCPDKHSVASQLISKDSAESETWVKGNTDVPTYFPDVEMTNDGEDWDAEVSVPRIGVHASAVAGISYYKSMAGLQKAQKKAYYNNLRKGDDDANVKLFEGFNTQSGNAEHQAGDTAATESSVSVATFAQPSVGRGRGRGVAAAQAAAVKPGADQSPASLDEMKRIARKTKKKLKQIEQLLKRQAAGELLNEEERVKVTLKETFERDYKKIMDNVEACEKSTGAD